MSSGVKISDSGPAGSVANETALDPMFHDGNLVDPLQHACDLGWDYNALPHPAESTDATEPLLCVRRIARWV